MSTPFHMWTFLRDKKGLRTALADYYPEMKDDPRIVAALAQIENGVRAIDSIMGELADMEERDGTPT